MALDLSSNLFPFDCARQGLLDGFEGDSPPYQNAGFGEPRRQPLGYNLFLAVLTSLADAGKILVDTKPLRQQLGIPLQGLQSADRLHATVLNLNQGLGADGLPPQLVIDAIVAALSGIRFGALQLRFDRLRGFRDQAFTLRCEARSRQRFIELRRLVTALLRRVGQRPLSNGDPHMTLHYRMPHSVGDLPMNAIEYPAERLVLILSHVGLHRHDHLVSWPLH
ncbi:hypothetical protein [Roseateles violae]|uniref:2'-5' RNA ligase n=1 Tax=Roseateles violae TaxID=3058042 RepID=A0ABT8DYQ0_9BURK|nr:hypothetical protein [Pelomonas sp. PFR6]MDN3922699.1 hypothetical protein [Pelomonas sp. PFR6]